MKLNCLNRFKDDRGVSVTEILVTLFILSLVMVTLFRLGSSLLPLLEKSRQENMAARQERVIRRVLAREFSLLCPPWWLSSYEIDLEENQWSFPWYGGNQKEYLSVKRKEENLVLIQPNGSLIILKGDYPIEMTLLSTRKAAPALVKVVWKKSKKTMYFLLGSRVVPGAGLP